MLAVGLGETEVRTYLDHFTDSQLCVACVNSAKSTTISGDEPAIDGLKRILDTNSIFARKLKVDTAYHSPHMHRVAADYGASLGNLTSSTLRNGPAFYSTVTAAQKSDGFGAEYWVSNLVSPVRFSEGVALISEHIKGVTNAADCTTTFIEIGPSGALAGPSKETLSSSGVRYQYVSVLNREENARLSLFKCLGRLLEAGGCLDTKALSISAQVDGRRPARLIPDLPSYSFDESSYWAESRISAAHRFRPFPYHDLCGLLDPASNIFEPRWRHHLSLDSLPWLKDHVIDDAAVFPASGYIAMAIEALRQLRQIRNTPGVVKNFLINEANFVQPISIRTKDTNTSIEVQLTMSPSKTGARWDRFRFFSYDTDGGSWIENCSGLVAVEVMEEDDEVTRQAKEASNKPHHSPAVNAATAHALEHDILYRGLAAFGNKYGPTFSLVGDARYEADRGFAMLSTPDFSALIPGHHMQPHVVHPTTLDAIIHVATFLSQRLCLDTPMVVGKINDMTVSAYLLAQESAKLLAVSTLSPQDSRTVVTDTQVFEDNDDSAPVPVIQVTHTLQAFKSAAGARTSGPFWNKPPLRIIHQPDPTFTIHDDASSESETLQNLTVTMKVICTSDSETCRAIVSGLQQHFPNGSDCIVSITELGEAIIDPSATYIILDRAEKSILLSNSEDDFLNLQRLLTSEVNVVWVSLRESSAAMASSTASMVNGAFRVLRRENGESSRLSVFNVEDVISTVDLLHLCDCLAKIVSTATTFENEFVYRNACVMVPRLQIDDSLEEWVNRKCGNTNSVTDQPYHQPGRPLQVEVGVPGLLNTIRFTDDLSATEPLQPWEIQIEAKAHGVNFKDVFISLGKMPASVNMVGEVSGVVKSVGKDMQKRYSPGDRVMGFFAKPFASMPRLNGDLACPIPPEMDFQTAATIPCTYATAFHCLFQVAHFQRGQSVLITAASGGVGQAAIQLAQHAGAGEIFVTLGSVSKKKLVMETYNIPESHVFSSRNVHFKEGIRSLTNGRGVDVVINSLTGDMLSEALDCVAKLGTFCEIGKGDIYNSGQLSMKPFDRSITFAAVDLVVVAENMPEAVHRYLADISDLFTAQSLRPVTPINVFQIEEIESAFRSIAGRKHTGKIVLDSSKQSTVRATLPKSIPLQLSGDGVYVIAGGLGGVGTHLTKFLASKGAGHIVLLSRRKVEADARERFLDELALPRSTKLHFLQCDIAQASQVDSCAKFCQSNLGTVKGVIHSAMVLSDRPFSTMSLTEFSAPLGPKVYGTINLDKSFASPSLDFFVMLSSSATIVGNGSQINYATANAFQDGFAWAHSTSQHTNYVALNLGAIETTAAISSTSQAQKNRLQSISMTVEETLLALEYAIGLPSGEPDGVQPIFGVSRQSLLDADDIFCLSSPLFADLPRAPQEHDGTSSKKKSDVVSDIRISKSMQDIQGLVQGALQEKCASFLDREVAEVPLDVPLSDIGFDSLVSVELKNWIVRTFEATIQTAQISSAAGVAALAATITSRSKLVDEAAK